MADKPILFSTPMVRALLAGNKTQTRRVLKPWPGYQSEWLSMEVLHKAPTCFLVEVKGKPGVQMQHPLAGTVQSYGPVDAMSPLTWVRLPCAVGDRLWVREAWSFGAEGCWTISQMQMARGHTKIDLFYRADPVNEHGAADGWLPSIHMPRWVSRLTLTVTDVRVQRLQEISEADAWAEGCTPGTIDDRGEPFPAEEPSADGKCMIGWDCARDWYADLWESLHGADAWDANPWVAAYTFTVEKMNIDNRVPS